MRHATHFAAVAILVAAGCTIGDSAGLTVASKDCVHVGGTPDDGPPISDVVCGPEDILPLPAGGMGLVIQSELEGVQFDGRVYLDPDEVRTIPDVRFVPTNPASPTPEVPPAVEGTVAATAYENGVYAPARVEVWENGNHVLTTTSGTPFALAGDTYDVTLWLDGVLDRPHQTFRVTVEDEQPVSLAADFATSILEVRVREDGAPAAGMAELLRHGQRVGTLGTDVARRLSSGTYDVAVHHRTETKVYEAIHLAPAQRRALTVDF